MQKSESGFDEESLPMRGEEESEGEEKMDAAVKELIFWKLMGF